MLRITLFISVLMLASVMSLYAMPFECKPPAHQENIALNITLNHGKTQYNHTKSYKELGQFQIDTHLTNHRDAGIVGGLMSGQMSFSSNLLFGGMSNRALQKSCLWLTQINVTLTNQPTIYIAREYEKNGCRYRSTLEHEERHATVDRLLIEKYKAIFTKELNSYIATRKAKGPFPSHEKDLIRKEMVTDVEKILIRVMQRLQEERNREQNKIDSPAEYARLSRMCPEEDMALKAKGYFKEFRR